MNYVKALDFLGVVAKEIPCIVESGAPTASTEGAVGCFYMNDETGDVYKCTASSNGVYTWKSIGGGGIDEETLNAAIEEALTEAKENGEFDGPPGDDGVSPTITVTTITGGHRITITDKNGTKNVDIMDGETGEAGADGRGITSIARTSGTGAAGATDTYTITYSDNTTSTFTVYNGKDGTSGVYVGETEPTDSTANVWINPESGVAIIPTIEHNTCSIFKKVVCVGDSFTSGHIHTEADAVGTNEDYAWPSYMARLTGNEYINCGASGATTITWLTMSRGLTKAKSTGVVQAYLVGLGLNDANNVGGITLGTAADIGTDAQTYYAGMSRIVRELNAISPKAKIFLQTMASNSSHTMACNVAIRDVVAAYADTYPVHLLDLEAYLPMYKTDLILGDKINGHYTAIGYQMFAENLRVIWSEYINSHIAEFQDVYTLPYDTN